MLLSILTSIEMLKDFRTATVICVCFSSLFVELKRALSISHESNSFSMMIQTNNNVVPAQTSPGLTRSAPRAVSRVRW